LADLAKLCAGGPLRTLQVDLTNATARREETEPPRRRSSARVWLTGRLHVVTVRGDHAARSIVRPAAKQNEESAVIRGARSP